MGFDINFLKNASDSLMARSLREVTYSEMFQVHLVFKMLTCYEQIFSK